MQKNFVEMPYYVLEYLFIYMAFWDLPFGISCSGQLNDRPPHTYIRLVFSASGRSSNDNKRYFLSGITWITYLFLYVIKVHAREVINMFSFISSYYQSNLHRAGRQSAGRRGKERARTGGAAPRARRARIGPPRTRAAAWWLRRRMSPNTLPTCSSGSIPCAFLTCLGPDTLVLLIQKVPIWDATSIQYTYRLFVTHISDYVFMKAFYSYLRSLVRNR